MLLAFDSSRKFELGAEADDALAQAGRFVGSLSGDRGPPSVCRCRSGVGPACSRLARWTSEVRCRGRSKLAGGRLEATGRSAKNEARAFGAAAGLSPASSRRRLEPLQISASLRCRGPALPTRIVARPPRRSNCVATSSELVGFVEDDGRGLGQNAGVGCTGSFLLDGEVGKEEVVVDDDDVGLESAAAHLGNEAALVVGTRGAQAGVGPRIEFVPERAGFGQAGELGAVAGLGFAFPCSDLLILVNLFEAGRIG